MLAWALRGILLSQIVASTVIVALCETHGGVFDVLGVFAAFVAIGTGGSMAHALILSRRRTPLPVPLRGPTPTSVATEWAAAILHFCIVMPFERVFMGAERIDAARPDRDPVLLVPGYMCNRGVWWWFRRRLERRGWTVATVTLETPLSDIETLADGLGRRIDEVLAATGATRVALVTHSMGGLVARALLRRPGAVARVSRFVTLAGPHHGTVLARLGLGRDAAQMRPDAPWLAELNRSPLPVPTLSIWSAGDQIVAPQDSSRLDGAAEIVLPSMGHMTMVSSAAVVELVAAELARGAPDEGRREPLTGAGRA